MTDRVKYPRTPHLPWSPGATSDDRIASNSIIDEVAEIPMIVTEKMDGGNVTLRSDCFYMRSVSSESAPWESYSKAVWSQVRNDIPPGWRISAESVWARRSVGYDNLPGPVLVFGVWDDAGDLLPWTDIETWAQILGLPTVPVIGNTTGVENVDALWRRHRDESTSEGFVVRVAGEIPGEMFHRRVFKWVRPGHVTTEAAWRHRDDFAVNGISPKG